MRQLAPLPKRRLLRVYGDHNQPSIMSLPARKRILLVDVNDPRAKTRVKMLVGAGYEVEVREDDRVSELLAHEDSFDLILLSLHRKRRKTHAPTATASRRNFLSCPYF